MRVVFVDFETSGLVPGKIVEIGVCVVNDGEIVDIQSRVVNPGPEIIAATEQQIALHGLASTIHGISPAEMRAAKTFQENEAWLLDLLFSADVVSAYNYTFDKMFLETEISRSYPEKTLYWYDMYAAAKKHLSLPMYTLRAVARFFNIEQTSAHRAGDDATVTGGIFLRLQRLGVGIEIHEQSALVKRGPYVQAHVTYGEKDLCSSAGGIWDKVNKRWMIDSSRSYPDSWKSPRSQKRAREEQFN